MEVATEHSQPFLTSTDQPEPTQQDNTVFSAATADILLVIGPKDFAREFLKESRKLWYLADPAIFNSISKYSLDAITQVFTGHLGAIDLAAVSVENSIIAGSSASMTVYLTVYSLIP